MLRRSFFFIISISFIIFSEMNILASICFKDDNRTLSENPKIARVRRTLKSSKNCTATLISPNCMITAKHCRPYMEFVEFQVPLSTETGILTSSDEINRYQINQDKVWFGANIKDGNDWAVFQVEKHSIENEWPGSVNGYYHIEYENPFPDDISNMEFSVTGYGKDKAFANRVQQNHMGQIIQYDLIKHTTLHQIDSTSGNSGSSIINIDTQKIVGIHVTGGCGTSEISGNKGILIHDNTPLINAIKSCLKDTESKEP